MQAKGRIEGFTEPGHNTNRQVETLNAVKVFAKSGSD